MNKDQKLRASYPRFIYHRHSWQVQNEVLHLNYEFEIVGLEVFNPRWEIPLASVNEVFASQFQAGPRAKVLDRLVFLLGMVELISYWKLTCSPYVLVKAGPLNDAEISFWLDLYFGGLGEFFYINKCALDRQNFMNLQALNTRTTLPFTFSLEDYQAGRKVDRSDLPKVLVPIGGGKDSIVTLEFLRSLGDRRYGLAINPTQASLATAEVSGLRNCLYPRRFLDAKMLELNKQGYLNGHTPFSAIVAFSALLIAYIYDLDDIVLSNEGSANEPSVHGQKINHQFSKSSDFERSFQLYIKNEIGLTKHYFSLLRPMSELLISANFAQFPAYHPYFRSCNLGSKTDSWCGKCGKCLFVACILAPFVGLAKVEAFIGKDIFADASLEPLFWELLGQTAHKPFECVGTVAEVKLALDFLLWRCLNPQGLKSMSVLLPVLASLYHNLDSEPLFNKVEDLPFLLAVYWRYLNKNCRDINLYEQGQGLPQPETSQLKQLLSLNLDGALLPSFYLDFLPDLDTRQKEAYRQLILTSESSGIEQAIYAAIPKAQSYLIIGFGREGRSILKTLLQALPEDFEGRIGIADLNPLSAEVEKDLQAIKNLTLHIGEDYLLSMGAYEVAFKSPGISLKDFNFQMQNVIDINAAGAVSNAVKSDVSYYSSDNLSKLQKVKTKDMDAPLAESMPIDPLALEKLTVKSSNYLQEFPHTYLTCQTDLFLRVMRKRTIGVTGTKGKSTTTSLIYACLAANQNLYKAGATQDPGANQGLALGDPEIDGDIVSVDVKACQRQGQPAFLLGNIGRAPLTAITEITPEANIALELSCHQLELMETSPHIGLITNIYPEHLDHYQSFGQYSQAKLNILRYQTGMDFAILNALQLDYVYQQLPHLPSRVIIVGPAAALLPMEVYRKRYPDWHLYALVQFKKTNAATMVYEELLFDGSSRFELTIDAIPKSLGSIYHAADYAMAIAACRVYQLAASTILTGLKSFKGLPHRLEYVGRYQGIEFYNDSISTIPETCISALETLGKVDVLILGGMDRNIAMDKLFQHLAATNHQMRMIICLPDTGMAIADALCHINGYESKKPAELNLAAMNPQTAVAVVNVRDLDEAVQCVYQQLEPDTVCLFSPAAASYHLYKNFEARGEHFKTLVQNAADALACEQL